MLIRYRIGAIFRQCGHQNICIYVTPLLPLRYCIISGTLYTVKAGYNEFDGTRENIPYNQKFLITKVTFYSEDYNYL